MSVVKVDVEKLVEFIKNELNLEELKVFKDLFTEFNQRYDTLNDKIVVIARGDSDEVATQKTLDDYFNLCSEEYLFYTRGLIINEVWGAWCRGMKENLKIDAVNCYWEKAQDEESYYGLTTEIIEKGSKAYK